MRGSIASELPATAPPDPLASDPRWQLIDRIIASRHIGKSARLADFLRYVSRETLLGHAALINEQRIGVAVFERRIDYDSSDDNIVRSHASRLRQKLEAYFQDEGQSEPLRIVLPRGSYVPLFEPNPAPATAPNSSSPIAVVPAHKPVPSASIPRASHRLLVFALGFALLLISAIALYQWRSNVALERTRHSDSPVMRSFWTALFSPGRRAIIVPADSSLVLFENITEQNIPLRDYIDKTYLNGDSNAPSVTPEAIAQRIGHRRLTSIADLELTSQLQRIPEVAAARPEIRFARDLQIEDLKQANAVLIGAAESNPWLAMFQSQRNFILSDDQKTRIFTIVNRAPLAGEPAFYRSDPQDPKHTAYALIALLPNLSGNGRVLIVEGTSIAGTEAAAEFLTNPAQMSQVLDAAWRRSGAVPPFEILLETTNLNGSGSQSRVVASRFY